MLNRLAHPLRLALPALFLAGAALAQTAPTEPDMDDAVAGAKNQLGVLEYCQAAGHIDDTAVEIQTKMIAMLPAAIDTAQADAGYAKGKSGTVSAMGVEQSLSDSAKTQGTDEAALCKQMAEMMVQAAQQMGL